MKTLAVKFSPEFETHLPDLGRFTPWSCVSTFHTLWGLVCIKNAYKSKKASKNLKIKNTESGLQKIFLKSNFFLKTDFARDRAPSYSVAPPLTPKW